MMLLDDFAVALNSRDWAKVQEFWTEDVIVENFGAGTTSRGREANIEDFKSVEGFASDFRITVKSQHECDGWLIAEYEHTGTQTGQLPDGAPATNRSYSIPGVFIAELDSNGKVKAVRNYFNRADFLQQLGLLPAPA